MDIVGSIFVAILVSLFIALIVSGLIVIGTLAFVALGWFLAFIDGLELPKLKSR